MTSATQPDLREALAPLASWLAARDGYGFDSELSPDEQQAYVCQAGTCLEQSGLAAFVMAALAERDAALKTMEMCATSGAFHAKHAENATARADALERTVTGLGEENERLKAALKPALAFVDRAAGEGLGFIADEDWPALDAADTFIAVAKLLGEEFDSPAMLAMSVEGRVALAQQEKPS